MSIGARILKNTTFLTLGDKIGYLMQFVFFLYFAKEFGVVPVGEYSFAFFFTYAFATLADSGVSTYLLREVGRNTSSDRQLFVDCLVLRIVSLFLTSVLFITVMSLFFRNISTQKTIVIFCWGIYWILNQIADVFLAELNGHEKMGRVALLGALSKFLSTISGMLLIFMGYDYDFVLIVFPITGFIYLVGSVIVSKYSLGPLHIKFKKLSFYKNFYVELLPFFFTVILIEIINCQDILILGFIKDDHSIGIYSSAIKLVTFVVSIAAFIQIAILPVLSKLYVESREKLIDISEKILRYLILSCLPISFGLALTADKIIILLYPDSFQQAGIVLKITCWSIVGAFVQSIFSALLTAINRQKEKVVFIGIAFVISTLLNILLIYHFDYIGASIVKLITIFICLIFFAFLVSKFLTTLSIMKFVLKPVVACLIMSIFIRYCYQWNLFYLIPVSGLIYFISLLFLKTFSSKELLLVKGLIPERIYIRK
jgi:O-antigen/teichoic acid export membrane protein